MSLSLLIVEDDTNVIKLYQKEILEWNDEETTSVKISPTIAKNKIEAELALKSSYFDAAIIDIRLDNYQTNKTEGNEVLDIIYEKIRFPTYVFSSNIQELHEKYDRNHFISKYARDSIQFNDLLLRIVKRFSTGITNILGQRGKLEEALDRVFWHHLPDAISHWEESSLDASTKEKQLLRYTLSHLLEMLATGEDGAEDKRNRAEIYIYPPIKKSPAAGLVCKRKDNNRYAMVITPSCDLAQKKADFIQLVDIISFHEIRSILNKTGEKRNHEIRNYVSNGKNRFHFLPHFSDIPPCVVDFQRISVIDTNSFSSLYEPVCSISTFFYKDIAGRFSAYYSRQGSPDFDFGLVSLEINDLLPKNKQ